LVFAPVYSAVAPAVSTIWMSREIGAKVQALDLPTDVKLYATGYTEPSLAFYLGSRLMLLSPWQIGNALPKKGWLAVVGHTALPEFRTAMSKRGVTLKSVGTIFGFNYSRGRQAAVTLYRPAAD
ncbi:MAG: hypothetical protein OXC54_11580, partial [Rhodospirillaceae bacterium]|nr:hypothetical protein [Rhodospirillaceae bacterium]